MASVSAVYMSMAVILFHWHTHRYTLTEKAPRLRQPWRSISGVTFMILYLSGPVQHPSLRISVTLCLVLFRSRNHK